MANKKFAIGTSLVCTFAIVAACVVAVDTGVYAKFAEAAGLPVITSVSQLMPGADDMRRNNLGLNLSKPDAPTTGGQAGTDGQADGQSDAGAQAAQALDGGTLPASAASPLSMQDALSTAEAMPTAEPHTEGYDRKEQFGDWENSDQLCGSGTTRDYILQRDMSDVTLNEKCQVTSGTLRDPYTGDTIAFERTTMRNGKVVSGDSSKVQIDHVVALNDAYASGLWKADHATQVAYANDPDVLMASDGGENGEKGNGVNLYRAGASGDGWDASTPSVWLPDYEPWRCDYMAKRVYIKDKYGLTMSEWEKSETVDYLAQCAAG